MPEVDSRGIKGKNYYEEKGIRGVEFSDLIISELTAKEAIEWISEHYRDGEWIKCFERNYCMDEVVQRLGTDNVILKIAKWKADHDKKEPEIKTEWFWQGRIFKIEKDGGCYQIKGGNGFYDTGCKYRDDAEEYMEDKLKEHCKTNDGEFIAVVEHVCRVKAVE